MFFVWMRIELEDTCSGIQCNKGDSFAWKGITWEYRSCFVSGRRRHVFLVASDNCAAPKRKELEMIKDKMLLLAEVCH